MSPAPDDATPERLRAVPSRLLAGAAAAADRLVNDRLAAEDARKWHFAVLVALAETGPASQSELSRRTGVYRSDMVAVLNELADAGFLVRDPDPVDRRRNVVSLTPAGRARLQRLDALVTAAQQELLDPLSPAERTEFVRLLALLNARHRPSPEG
ncbi:hypothetical protein GCM10009759_28800 [Kitasatospora saccharophila]|uniref:HTH marR-type domain-containing protein n=1 Tax=Kitasatospora saccharophila TaxID=407973 RepID=A0ABP5IGQ3_9ACTN